jgi:nucleotide-binding universal stress UspA family protein
MSSNADAIEPVPRPASIVIGFDGSPGALRAIDRAAELFPGGRALVVACWRSNGPAARAAGTVMPRAMIAEAVKTLDAAARERALATATEGAQRAMQGGLDAEPVERCARAAIWSAISSLAEEAGATVVVVGARGHSDIVSAVLGSTSHGLVHHCAVPVLVVHGDR